MPSNSFSNFLVCCRRRLQSGKILVRCWTTSTGFFQQEKQWFSLGSLFVCDDEPNTLSRKFQGFGIWFFLSLYTKGLWGWYVYVRLKCRQIKSFTSETSSLFTSLVLWYQCSCRSCRLGCFHTSPGQSCLKKLHCIYLFGWVHTWWWESYQSDSDTMVFINEAHSTTIILVNMSSPAGGSQHLPLPGHHHHKVQERMYFLQQVTRFYLPNRSPSLPPPSPPGTLLLLRGQRQTAEYHPLCWKVIGCHLLRTFMPPELWGHCCWPEPNFKGHVCPLGPEPHMPQEQF